MFVRTPNAQLLPHLLRHTAIRLILGCLLLPRLICGQASQQQTREPSELTTALDRAGAGNADARDVVVLADAKAVQAIPALERQFRRSSDPDTKLSIASGLVRLGDRDDTYWNFLLEQATIAVDSDVPDSAFSESQGKSMLKSPELQAWAATSGISVDTAASAARYIYPNRVLQLAMSGDARGITLLRRALRSRNYLIVTWAVKGLAQVQDKESIPLIIAAVERAPAVYRPIVAESLVFFDDAQAQSAVDHFLPLKNATMAREIKARGLGIFGK